MRKKCVICGKEFTAKSIDAVACSKSCKKTRQLNRIRKWKKENVVKVKKRPKKYTNTTENFGEKLANSIRDNNIELVNAGKYFAPFSLKIFIIDHECYLVEDEISRYLYSCLCEFYHKKMIGLELEGNFIKVTRRYWD